MMSTKNFLLEGYEFCLQSCVMCILYDDFSLDGLVNMMVYVLLCENLQSKRKILNNQLFFQSDKVITNL